MRRSAHRDLDFVAQVCTTRPRGHFVCLRLDAGTDRDAAIDAHIQGMIAAGKAGPHDTFGFYVWILPKPDAPAG